MNRNVAGWDRLLRVVTGVLLLGLYGALEPPLKYATLAGLVLVATGMTGRCPLYGLFGFSTCRRTAE